MYCNYSRAASGTLDLLSGPQTSFDQSSVACSKQNKLLFRDICKSYLFLKQLSFYCTF